MVEEKNRNKIIGAVLAVIIFLAIVTIIIVNLPEEIEKNGETPNGETETVLSLTYGNETTNYTLKDLEALEEFTGKGTFIKYGALPNVFLEGPTNYTGIRVITLLNLIANLPSNYSIVVNTSDPGTFYYNKSVIDGQVGIYNESGNITQTGGVTMIFAYKKEGGYITEPTEGPLRIAFIDDGKITSSQLWARMVVSVELIEQK